MIDNAPDSLSKSLPPHKRRRIRLTETLYRPATLLLLSLSDVANKYGFIDARGKAPEPFDYFNHVGNTSTSILAGVTVSYVAARTMERSVDLDSTRVRRIAFGMGVAVVTALNVISETKLGVSFNTPDTLDMVYGVAAGAVAASLIEVKDSPGGYQLSNVEAE